MTAPSSFGNGRVQQMRAKASGKPTGPVVDDEGFNLRSPLFEIAASSGPRIEQKSGCLRGQVRDNNGL